jgi:hypothetical protein
VISLIFGMAKARLMGAPYAASRMPMTSVRPQFQYFQTFILLADGTRAAHCNDRGISARPGGSSQIKLYRLPARRKGRQMSIMAYSAGPIIGVRVRYRRSLRGGS